MATTQIKTRILNKIDSYSNWIKESAVVLKKGEIGIATIETADSAAGLTPPATGIKIGDGSSTFSQLPWIQAIAGDVSAFVKSANFANEAAFKTYVASLTTSDITSLNNAIDSLEARVDTMEGEIDDLQALTSGHTNSITGLTSRLGTAESDIANKADSTDVEKDIADAKQELNNSIDSISSKIGTTSIGTGTTITAAIKTLQDAVGASGEDSLGSRVETLENEMEAVQGDTSDLKPRMSTAEGNISTLQSITAGYTGANAIKNAVDAAAAAAGTEEDRAKAAEAGLAARIEKAEAFLNDANLDTENNNVIDTLKEIQTYIAEDQSGAVQMLSSIQENANAIKGLSDDITANANDIDAIKDGSDKTIKNLDDAIAANKTAAENATSALETALLGADGTKGTHTIKGAYDAANAAKSQADSGVNKATAAQDTLDALMSSSAADGDGLVSGINFSDNRIQASRRKIKMTDIDDTTEFIFNCGNAT